MDMVLTLIAAPNNASALDKNSDRAIAALRAAGCTAGENVVLSAGEACDIPFTTSDTVTKRLSTVLTDVDWAVQIAVERNKRMLIADMDSTMITVECIDELADFVGMKDKVSAITEAAMRGELDFDAALHERVALLKDLPLTTMQSCFDERVKHMSGAMTLIKTMNARGVLTVLVSGGFTFFTDRVGGELGFKFTKANVLEIADDTLTGRVTPPVVNAATKLETLQALRSEHGFTTSEVIAVGDGANDIPMIEAAGLGVAYHAKPKAAAAADVALHHTDLTALLFLQGIKRTDFTTS